jgi:hypothetical protein
VVSKSERQFFEEQKGGGMRGMIRVRVGRGFVINPRLPSRAVTHGAVFLFLLALLGCSLITPYDPTSYKIATDLKVDSLALLDKSTEPAQGHLVEIQDLEVKVRKAFEYEKGKGDLNSETEKMWALLADPQGDLLGGALRMWKETGKGLGKTFVEEKAAQVAEGFDKIIKLESGKVKK